MDFFPDQVKFILRLSFLKWNEHFLDEADYDYNRCQ